LRDGGVSARANASWLRGASVSTLPFSSTSICEIGCRRIETYNTTLARTTKLRDGSVYLDPAVVDFKRWRQTRSGEVPSHPIFSGV
jgi:hypothetical protein